MSAMLQGKIGVITGAASGIGRAAALAFTKAGASLVLSDRDGGGLETTRQMVVAQGGCAVTEISDVSDPAASVAMVNRALKEFGRLDIALNNAGVIGLHGPLADYPLDAWDRTIGINLSGVFYCMRAQLPAMLASGGGCIVNIASIAGLMAFQNQSGYVASKHGVIGLTKAVCNEYGPKGIRCNAIAPGAIATPMLPGDIPHDFINRIPTRRAGQPDEIAATALWLCSSAASYVNGICVPVDGGFLVE